MKNREDFEFERKLFEIVRAADPETVRGALAGAIRHSQSTHFCRTVYSALRRNVMPGTGFHRDLHSLRITESA